MDAAAIGALLTGLASLVTALTALRKVKNVTLTKANEDCDKRVHDIRTAFEMGMRVTQRASTPRATT